MASLKSLLFSITGLIIIIKVLKTFDDFMVLLGVLTPHLQKPPV